MKKACSNAVCGWNRGTLPLCSPFVVMDCKQCRKYALMQYRSETGARSRYPRLVADTNRKTQFLCFSQVPTGSDCPLFQTYTASIAAFVEFYSPSLGRLTSPDTSYFRPALHLSLLLLSFIVLHGLASLKCRPARIPLISDPHCIFYFLYWFLQFFNWSVFCCC